MLALVALLALNSHVLLRMPALPAFEKTKPLTFIPPRAPRPATLSGPAGGSRASLSPAPRRYFVPPTPVHDPKLALPVSLDFDAPAVVLAASDPGDPYSKLPGHALGTGADNYGIGKAGCCGGVGGGVGHPITGPSLIYKVEPEFSEEARKAKFQGMVVLSVEVDASGRPAHLVVVSSPGLGLDQKALDAVAQWRFRPAYRDGRPLTTTARIEVNFHLL